MVRPLNPLAPLFSWRRKDASAQKLYGAIVAQARLPVFYQSFGVPDTLQGRFVLLSLNLFAVLHRLKAEGAKAQDLAQELMDQFSADMETVLREIGVGDLSIAAIAKLLDLRGVKELSFAYRLSHGGGERLRLEGQADGRRDPDLRCLF
jgi:cytochrome b pre-mRNA-processing protein 3